MRRENWMVVKWVVLVLLLVGIFASIGITQDAEAKGKDASYWYEKYKQEERRSARLQRKIVKLKPYRRLIRGMGPFARSMAPWDGLAQCESGNRWHIATGNRFYGGVQFTSGTWRSFGGRVFSRNAHQATPIQQVAIAQKVLKVQGRNAWPGCTKKDAW